ncbi:MAG TPA: glycosyltransferase [Nitrospira sp.]|nr:glycosyltransferase [Nitrospira sp.]
MRLDLESDAEPAEGPAIAAPPSARRAADRSEAPIRLLKFLAYLAIGGTERQILNLAAGLDRRRFSVELGCFGHLRDQVAVDLSHTRVLEYKIGKLYGVRALTQVLRLAGHMRRQHIDIVHAYNFYANVFAVPAARLAGVPVVLASIRDTGEYWTPRQRTVNRLVCRLADRVIVNADAIKTGLIAEGYDPERLVVIHNGIHCPEPVSNPDAAVLRREWNFPPNAPLVGVVARIAPQKGLEYFLRAVPAISSRVPDARFVIVGDNCVNREYRDGVEHFSRRLGLEHLVRFTGFRLDVPRLLPCLAVSVLPSISGEGLSNSLLESMAAGVPVVATTVGGNPEVVLDGVTGLLVPSHDPDALANAVCRVLQDPGLAAAFGHAARRRVLERFANDRMIRDTERLYHELLRHSTRPRWAAAATM